MAQAAGEVPYWLKLLEADVLRSEGRMSEARSVLLAVHASHPDNIWAAFHLAGMARADGDLAAARGYLEAALSHDPVGERVWLSLLEADILRDEGRETEARAVLERAVARFPGNMRLHQRLGQIAERHKDFGAARAHYDAALQIDGSDLGLHLSVVQLMIDEGRAEAAIERLEMLRTRFSGDMRVLLALVRASQDLGRTEAEQACLAEAVTIDPLFPGLLRHLFATRAGSVSAEELQATTDRLRRVGAGGVADELLITSQLRAMQFQEALHAIRRADKRRHTGAGARRLASALFGAHRYAVGLRYVRLCMRRWPGDQALWTTYVTQGLKHGRIEEIGQRIGTASGQLPAHVILNHRLMLYGYRNDLDGAVDCYEQLKRLGRDTPTHRTVLSKLIYTRQDPLTADALYARIGNPGAENAPLLHRGGLTGMMTLEFDLERRALAETGRPGSLKGWVRARPGSTIAAIRLVDAWRADQAGQGAASGADSAAIPRQIFQYWDNPDPPAALAPIVASWSAVPGYSHRLMDRIDALRFLRETFGGDWVRAFQLAQNAAQEADFLRLCLLAKSGGIWADADDFLYGDLNQVLAQGKGLILYREPLGGALGNNIMAAPPGHPVVVYAARLACQVLLQRANENAWNKTGPGLLTRAVAHYLVKVSSTQARRQLTVLDWAPVARQISMHNPVRYKTSAAHWDTVEVRKPADPIWEQFQSALQARVDQTVRNSP